MQRPTGVTVIAVLDFIGAAFGALFAIGAFVGGTFIGAIISQAASQSGRGGMGAGIGAAIGAVIGVFFLIMAALSALLGWGMWSLKEWARIVQIVFAAIGACLQLLGIMGSMAHLNIFAVLWNLLWLAVNAYIIYYLIQPPIKAAFAGQAAAGYVPPTPPPPPAMHAGS